MLAESPCVVVSDPSIVLMDGLPRIDFWYDNLKPHQYKKSKDKTRSHLDHEFDIVRFGSQRYFSALNKIQHTRKAMQRVVASDSHNYLQHGAPSQQSPTVTGKSSDKTNDIKDIYQ